MLFPSADVAQTLAAFENVNVWLLGASGSGKSTLLKAITNDDRIRTSSLFRGTTRTQKFSYNFLNFFDTVGIEDWILWRNEQVLEPGHLVVVEVGMRGHMLGDGRRGSPEGEDGPTCPALLSCSSREVHRRQRALLHSSALCLEMGRFQPALFNSGIDWRFQPHCVWISKCDAIQRAHPSPSIHPPAVVCARVWLTGSIARRSICKLFEGILGCA